MRDHRTMVVVDLGSMNDEFSERASRLVESLNHEGDSPAGTIKADLFSVNKDGVVCRGLERTDDRLVCGDTQEGKVDPENLDAELAAVAAAAGYSQIVTVRNTYTG